MHSKSIFTIQTIFSFSVKFFATLFSNQSFSSSIAVEYWIDDIRSEETHVTKKK